MTGPLANVAMAPVALDLLKSLRFRVWGQGSGFRVQGSGFRVQGLGLRVSTGTQTSRWMWRTSRSRPESRPLYTCPTRALRGGADVSIRKEALPRPPSKVPEHSRISTCGLFTRTLDLRTDRRRGRRTATRPPLNVLEHSRLYSCGSITRMSNLRTDRRRGRRMATRREHSRTLKMAEY